MPDSWKAAADLIDLIERLLATGDYDWARDTLEGIKESVERTNRVTPRQRESVERIMVGRLKHDVGH